MGESLLKREFKKSDVQRVRNIVNKDYSAKTKDQIGYEKQSSRHKEGDIWEEGGKTWTIKNGLKRSVSKLQVVREYVNTPLVCPKCGGPMKTRLDSKFYRTHGTCYTCVVKFEDKLKLAGLWKEYEQAILSQNIKLFVQDLVERIQAMKQDTVVEVVTDEGTVEHWGKISNEIVKGLEEWAELLTKGDV